MTGIIFVIFGVFCFVAALAFLVFPMDIEMEKFITLGFVKLYFNDVVSMDQQFMKYYLVLGLFIVAVFSFVIFYVTKLIRRILVTIKEGRPFEKNVPEILRKIAWIVLGGGFIIQLVYLCESVILLKAIPLQQFIIKDAVDSIEYLFTMDFSFVFIAMTLFFLSYIFAYGVSLQIESDETL